MAAGSRSGVYRAVLFWWVLSSMVIRGRFKSGQPNSSVKGLLS